MIGTILHYVPIDI